MALDIDTSRPLIRPTELRALVKAILNAHESDEPSWLEWKSGLDLATAAGRFHVAKAVLGLANRMPSQAAPHCGGFGYIVVGAEPGNPAGVTPVDPASLDDGISPYVGGSRGPRWGSTYVELGGSLVLVVTVDSPRLGDPIFTLRKTYKNYHAGTIFVRKNGKTAPADDHDMDLLQERLRSASPAPLELGVSVAGDLPLSWFDPSTVRPALQRWVASRTSVLIAAAEQQARASRGAASRLEILTRFPNPLVKEDERTLEDYTSEVETWGKRLLEFGLDALPSQYVDRGHGVIKLRATNPTDRNLKEVLVRAKLASDDVHGLDRRPSREPLPRPPRAFGEPVRLDVGLSIAPVRLRDWQNIPSIEPIRSTWVEDGSMRIVWNVGDLRPRESDESDEVYVFVTSRPSEGALRGVWEATSKNTDGVLEGELLIPLAVEPVDVTTLFDDSAEETDSGP